MYSDTLTGSGCDTILTIDLHINNYSYGSQFVTNCPGNTYTWNGRTYNQTGIYRDTLATTGCDSIDVLYLDVPEIIREVYYDTICTGESYTWGAHQYGDAGIYNDTVPFGLCYKTRELNLYVAEPAVGDTAEQSYTVQFYDSITLNACMPSLIYRWNYGDCLSCSTITVKPTEEYNYYRCEAINEYGCIATCYYTVMIEGIYGNVFVPNIFTPNSDGNNDEFKLYGKNIRFHNLQVFNRWGEKIFDTDNENNGWDGTYKGEPQPPGVYVYIVKYSPLYNAENRNIKGSVTLFR
jgi:gliding motility-associated-like protein